MNWIKATIITTSSGIDAVSGRLLDLGISGIEISDKEDFKEFLENNRKYWDYVDEELERLKDADTTITFYLPYSSDGTEQLNAVKSSMNVLKALDTNSVYGSLEIITDNVKDEDWNEIWKQYFHPIPIGERLFICPEWEKSKNPDNRTVFTVNPGMSFGTGSHPSTRFCLEEAEKYIKSGDTVLDLGCGSGILSICSLLLGAKCAVCVDIDENAESSVKNNLALNNLSDKLCDFYSGDITSDANLRKKLGKHKVVFANIVANVIIAISPYIKDFMSDDGILITSGIILERLDEVKSALTDNGLDIISIKTDDEWAEITAK